MFFSFLNIKVFCIELFRENVLVSKLLLVSIKESQELLIMHDFE